MLQTQSPSSSLHDTSVSPLHKIVQLHFSNREKTEKKQEIKAMMFPGKKFHGVTGIGPMKSIIEAEKCFKHAG